MQSMNLGVVIIVAVVVLALLIFLVVRNKKDRKELLPPDGIDDPVEVKREEDEFRRDKI
ncbi:MAG TPA: hypothetical protein VGC22_01685 [Chitinophaga sp.]